METNPDFGINQRPKGTSGTKPVIVGTKRIQ